MGPRAPVRAVGPRLCSWPGSPGGFFLIGPRCGAGTAEPQPRCPSAWRPAASRGRCFGPGSWPAGVRGASGRLSRRPAQWGSPLAPSRTEWLRICSDLGLGFPAAEPEGVFFWCVCACCPWSVAGLGTKDTVFKILTNSNSFFFYGLFWWDFSGISASPKVRAVL